MKEQILAEIRQALRYNADEKASESGKRYFKEEVKMYGVGMKVVNKIGRLTFEKLRDSSRQEIFEICEELWRSGYNEEGYIACDLSYYMHRQYEPADFAVFERWVNNYITNWATCDTLCNHTVGTFVEMYPEYVAELKKWAHSTSRWVKRAAAVTLIVPARKGLFLDDILQIADTLMFDPDDLVQKGYGWMLKAASMRETSVAARKAGLEVRRKHLEAVFGFVMRHRTVMPRTALRYAIEKMPPEMRAEAMKK